MFAASITALVVVVLVLATLLLVLRSLRFKRKSDPPEEDQVHAGDYVTSDGHLYRIEYVRKERVLIEDCGSGDLFDAGVAEVKQLPVVKWASHS